MEYSKKYRKQNQYVTNSTGPIRLNEGDIINLTEFEVAMWIIENNTTDKNDRAVLVKPKNPKRGEEYILISFTFSHIRKRIIESDMILEDKAIIELDDKHRIIYFRK